MIKHRVEDLAALGGTPVFSDMLHVGQMNLPGPERLREAFQGIFHRHYYTNHGPLVHAFEEALAQYIKVRHAVCVVNGTIALMVAARALEVHGSVILPAFTFVGTVQAMTWAGMQPVFCDVDLLTHCITPEGVASVLREDTGAILPVHLWGRPCDVRGFHALSEERGVPLFYDASHAVGCSCNGTMIGNFGQAEVFSLHATKVLQAAEGGVITTNSDELAKKIRTVRNFHVLETQAPMDMRINAKMSEGQAAMGLMSLEDLDVNIANNRRRYRAYADGLGSIPGLHMETYDEEERNNYQYVVFSVSEEGFGLNRNQFLTLLQAENVLARKYFSPGVHRSPPYEAPGASLPVTDALSEQLVQLPSGDAIDDCHIAAIVELIAFLAKHSGDIVRKLTVGEGRA